MSHNRSLGRLRSPYWRVWGRFVGHPVPTRQFRKRAHSQLRVEKLERRLLLCSDFNGDGYDDLATGAPDYDVPGAAGTNHGAVIVIYGSAAGGLTTTAGPGVQFWTQDSVVGAVPIADMAEAGDHFGASVAAGRFNQDPFCDLAIGVPDEDIGAIVDAGAVNVIYGSPGGLTPGGAAGIPLNQFWHQGLATILDDAEAGDHFGFSLATGDFARNGCDDLAVGVPFEDSGGGIVDIGAVNVIYSTPLAGLEAAADQYWSQGGLLAEIGFVGDILGTPAAGDRFGWALAAGNFDGFDGVGVGHCGEDLAISAPWDDDMWTPQTHVDVVNAGVVHVLYSNRALVPAPPPCGRGQLALLDNQYWHQNVPLFEGTAGEHDNFGYALAAGNFDGAFGDDLAIGAPHDNEVPGAADVIDAGVVNVLYDAPDTLPPPPPGLWPPLAPGATGATGGDRLLSQAGVVDDGVLLADLVGTPAAGDRFGYALATGYFGPGVNPSADLAVGVPYDDEMPGFAAILNAGAVNVVYAATPMGLEAAGNQILTQDGMFGPPFLGDLAGARTAGDRFGFALASGRFGGVAGDTQWDLAIGVPYEDVLAAGSSHGGANVVYNVPGGLLDPAGPPGALSNQLWVQTQAGARFGYALAAADSSSDGHDAVVAKIAFPPPIDLLGGLELPLGPGRSGRSGPPRPLEHSVDPGAVSDDDPAALLLAFAQPVADRGQTEALPADTLVDDLELDFLPGL